MEVDEILKQSDGLRLPRRRFVKGMVLCGAILGLVCGYVIKYDVNSPPAYPVNWSRSLGERADFARTEGAEIDDIQFISGVRVWF